MKCEVLVDRVSLVVGKGSIVNIDDRQFELARQFVKPIQIEKPVEAKPVEAKANDVVEEKKSKKKK